MIDWEELFSISWTALIQAVIISSGRLWRWWILSWCHMWLRHIRPRGLWDISGLSWWPLKRRMQHQYYSTRRYFISLSSYGEGMTLVKNEPKQFRIDKKSKLSSFSSGASAGDNEMTLLCSLDDERPSMYTSYTTTITIRYTTGLRALAQYNDGFVANYTLSEYRGLITGGSATSCPYCSDWGVWGFFSVTGCFGTSISFHYIS